MQFMKYANVKKTNFKITVHAPMNTHHDKSTKPPCFAISFFTLFAKSTALSFS